MFLRDIDINGVVAVGTSDTINKGKVHHLRMLAQPPDIGLLSGEACAMNAALLTCADADGLTVFHIAHTVGLCVFQRNEGDDEIAAQEHLDGSHCDLVRR